MSAAAGDGGDDDAPVGEPYRDVDDTSGDDAEPDAPPLRALPRRPARDPNRGWRDGYQRKEEATRLRELLAAVVAARHVRLGDLRQDDLFANWKAYVGERIAAHTRPREIDSRKVLHVDVTSPAWVHELTLLRPRIVEDLTTKLGVPRLFDDIKLWLAGGKRRT